MAAAVEDSMKTLGLIGGMSWESSAIYYRLLNENVKEKLGGYHSCKSLMLTLDFDEIYSKVNQGDWRSVDRILIDAALKLEKAGAEIIMLCANTAHISASAVQNEIGIPLLHIAEATGQLIEKKGLKKVALLGTKFTMTKTFYKDYLKENFEIEAIVPDEDDMQYIHSVIFDELILGQIREESKNKYLQIIQKLQKEGAEGVILGCTEIPLLIQQKDVNIPVFDTTVIHAEKAVDWAIQQ